MKHRHNIPAPSESAEQMAVIEWAEWHSSRYPELRFLHHIPNGGKRSPATAARLRLEGVKPGVPDLCLPVPRGDYHGLYIEMKACRGKLREEQREWLRFLEGQGYHAVVCRGWEEAVRVIEGYLACVGKEEVEFFPSGRPLAP